VGKTTLAALLSHVFVEQGQRVLAIDADPAAGLAAACGVPPDEAAAITPVAEMEDLIYERTGARKGEIGGYFKLNPRVDDIPDRFAVSPSRTETRQDGIRILTMGTVKAGGTGCLCPENALLRSLVTHLLLRERETVILEERILGVPGSGFGRSGYFRLSYCVETETIEKALPGLRKVMEAL
jgi:CO dehydrogenase maturation factor